MPNRLLTRDEVYVEIDALFARMGLKPPQRVVADDTPIGARIEPPVVSETVRAAPDLPGRGLPQEEANARLHAHGMEPPPPAVPDAVRAACAHCFHRLDATEMCCWCGQPRALQHGPYLPLDGVPGQAEGDR